jgi:cation diffusion facilitator family transporter
MNFTDLDDASEHSTHTPAERSAAASRSTWVSVGVNVVLSTTQIVVGVLAKSQGLIADGIHSLSDLVADFVVLFAGHHGQKDADTDHPYGHYRFETAASLALGVILLAVGLGMVWSAFVKLQTPDTIPTAHATALWVALAAIVSKELLFRYMLRVAKAVKSSMLVANAWHARSDAASSLVVSIGLIGNMAGYPLLDPIAALIVGFMVGKMGWGFGWDALHDLMDRAVDEEEVQAIRQTLVSTPRRGRSTRHSHPQNGRHDCGGRPYRSRRKHHRRSRAQHCGGSTPGSAAAPPGSQSDDARRPRASA